MRTARCCCQRRVAIVLLVLVLVLLMVVAVVLVARSRQLTQPIRAVAQKLEWVRLLDIHAQ